MPIDIVWHVDCSEKCTALEKKFLKLRMKRKKNIVKHFECFTRIEFA
jgi:hypothetical protein